MSTGRVYCGNLPATVREADVRGLFDQFGAIRSVDIKASSGGPSFAFVEFESRDHADEAVRARKDHAFEGQTLRVEASRNSNDRERDRERRPAQKRTDYRVIVSNLPPSGSWQDLKDMFRTAGDVCYTATHRDGTGTVEFFRSDDMYRAVDKLNDSRFRSHTGEEAVIRVTVDRRRPRSRSRSPRRRSPPRRYRSRSRSPPRRHRSRSRDRYRSRSPPPARDRYRSPPRDRRGSPPPPQHPH